MFLTTRGLVLREVKYREADRILTVLTEDEGKLTVRARGALRKGCRYGAATQLLSFSEMTLFGNRGRWTLNEGNTAEQFLGLRDDLAGFALGSYFAELLETVSDEDESDPALLQLGLNALFALSRGLYPAEHIKAAFELRLACLAGFRPALDGCGRCQLPDPTQPWFGTDAGSVYCASCREGRPGLPLCGASLAAMRYVVYAPARKIFSFTLDEAGAARFYAVCEAYILAQLDRGFGSLDYWKRVR